MTALLLGKLKKTLRRHGITLEGVLTGNGPEFVGRAFKTRVSELGLHHYRIPPRSPNYNSVCERFHGTVLEEFYRPHFHRGRVEDVALLDQPYAKDDKQSVAQFIGGATIVSFEQVEIG